MLENVFIAIWFTFSQIFIKIHFPGAQAGSLGESKKPKDYKLNIIKNPKTNIQLIGGYFFNVSLAYGERNVGIVIPNLFFLRLKKSLACS